MKNFIEILKNSSDKKEIEKANKGVHSFWKGILNMTPEDNKKFVWAWSVRKYLHERSPFSRQLVSLLLYCICFLFLVQIFLRTF